MQHLTDMKTTRPTKSGIDRVVELFVATPSPADMFIPEEDVLNIFLRFSISNRESQKSVARLKKQFIPEMVLMSSYYKMDTKKMRSEGKQWFCIEYHCYSMEAGLKIYGELKKKVFNF